MHRPHALQRLALGNPFSASFLLSLFTFAMLACLAVGGLQAAETATAENGKTDDAGKVELNVEGKYHITIDSTGSPELQDWAKEKLAPVVKEWYPMIVKMLPGKDFHAPREVTIKISDDIKGVAYTSGKNVFCNGKWMKDNENGEAKGAVVHELVHVVQQYGRMPKDARPPGWLVEGICDYIRWFLYEPETGGALISPRGADRARYNASYRTTGNFLNWCADNYGANFVPKLNARIRNGDYNLKFWSEETGKTVQELADAWKKSLADPDAAKSDDGAANQLTAKEKEQGWKLLFNGKNTDGWHSFKRDEVLPGWKVEEGVLVCQDPSKAGDLCTDDEYEWFELELEYNISQGGNSGIMYHVTNQGGAAWATGPEFQLEDNLEAHDSTRCGWLYALYQPPEDPDTGAPIDATKPAGQWNKVRLVVSPKQCVHEINGEQYLTYQLGSDDFKKRVKASKFGNMPLFAKPKKGMIALQGDHGVVSFRNIKVRPIKK